MELLYIGYKLILKIFIVLQSFDSQVITEKTTHIHRMVLFYNPFCDYSSPEIISFV